MARVLLALLLLSLAAVPPAAAEDVLPTEESDDAESIDQVNQGIPNLDGDIMNVTARNAAICTAVGCKWPKYRRYVRVPIQISGAYSHAERSMIIRILVTFHRSTCIRFVWRRWFHRSYLHFFPGSGCWGYIGRTGGRQLVSLRRNGCLYTSTVQHMVLHALGFNHEHVRSDRDSYVSILPQNIIPGYEHNFVKRSTNNLWTSYDFNSVMHYHNHAFSRNGQPTIVAKANPNLLFGRARQMSWNDITRVNRLYRCW